MQNTSHCSCAGCIPRGDVADGDLREHRLVLDGPDYSPSRRVNYICSQVEALHISTSRRTRHSVSEENGQFAINNRPTMETLKRSHHLIPHVLASSRRNRLSRNWVGIIKNPLASRLLACRISRDASFTQFDSTTRSDIMQIAFKLCGVEFKSLYTVPGAVYLIFVSSKRSEIKA